MAHLTVFNQFFGSFPKYIGKTNEHLLVSSKMKFLNYKRV